VRTQLAEATGAYKANLEKLVAIYEADAKQAEGRLRKMKELWAQNLITRRELQTSEDAAARARDKYVDAQAQLKGADVQCGSRRRKVKRFLRAQPVIIDIVRS
jgi:multidrug resistance efflux pump